MQNHSNAQSLPGKTPERTQSNQVERREKDDISPRDWAAGELTAI
jgi:hypothetical protein